MILLLDVPRLVCNVVLLIFVAASFLGVLALLGAGAANVEEEKSERRGRHGERHARKQIRN
jgi:hypothetical protein